MPHFWAHVDWLIPEDKKIKPITPEEQVEIDKQRTDTNIALGKLYEKKGG